jgi:hypothetical protein
MHGPFPHADAPARESVPSLSRRAVRNGSAAAGEPAGIASAAQSDRYFIFYPVSPENAPEELRAAVAEYLTRVHFGLVVGSFEMDWGDGEVRFKSSLDLRGERLTPALLEGVVQANLAAINRYLPNLLAVARGEMEAAEAAAAACED